MPTGLTHHVAERHRPISLIQDFWDMLGSADERGALIRRGLRRAWWWPILLVAWLWVGASTAAPMFEGWGLSDTLALSVAVVQLLLSALSLGLVVLFVLRAAYSRMRSPTWLFALISIAPWSYTCALADVGFGLSFPAAAFVASAVVAGFAGTMLRVMHKLPIPVNAPVWIDEPASAPDMVRDCEQALAGTELSDSERSAVEINLASALALVALSAEGDEALARACEILAAAMENAEPMEVYIGAARLVEAMAAKAARTGDIEGYDEALQLMLDGAGMLAQLAPRVLPRALLIRATHLSALSARADEDGQPGRAARLHREALEDLLKALELSPQRRTVHALVQLKFAALVDHSGGNLDAAIGLCRLALRRLRFGYAIQRDFGHLVLWDLLMERAANQPARARSDHAEAARLHRRLQRRAASRVPAAQRLPGLLRATDVPAAEVGLAYRDAFAGLSLASGSGAADLAREWASWADGVGDATEAAEAHWCWIRAVADDARRRPLRAEKERGLAKVLGLSARAGDRLVAAGRLRDAAVAFDLGRATLLTERMQRERDGLAERLVAAGHHELATRWEEACRQITQADRDGFVAGSDQDRSMIVAGRRFQRRFTSVDQVMLAEREELLRAIGRVGGFEDVDVPADYHDLRAAAGEGPLVYLSATGAGACAILVTEAPDPVVLPLALTTADVEPWVQHVGNARNAGELTDTLADLLPWLWTAIGEPLAARLEPNALVTLIPLGALAQLPIHAMTMAPDAEGIWRDRSAGLVLRYAPNARVLSRAQARADALAGGWLPVLTVAVPDAAGERVIKHARDESAAVVARFGASTEQPRPASRDEVLAAMDRCAIWHFACHGIHLPARPLDSRLVLADGALKLRTIFARPDAAARLAVLSACRTATVDERLVDEVVGFPSALLQAGVAGVVCAQSEVDDRDAMLLVLRFFDELAGGTAPARALARAQQWLCSATNAQIRAALGDVHGHPEGFSAAQRAYWDDEREFVEPHRWAPFGYFGA